MFSDHIPAHTYIYLDYCKGPASTYAAGAISTSPVVRETRNAFRKTLSPFSTTRTGAEQRGQMPGANRFFVTK